MWGNKGVENKAYEEEMNAKEMEELNTLLLNFDVGVKSMEDNIRNNEFEQNNKQSRSNESQEMQPAESNENNDPNISMINTYHPSTQNKSQTENDNSSAFNKINTNSSPQTPKDKQNSSKGK